jgi:hypothetical protein
LASEAVSIHTQYAPHDIEHVTFLVRTMSSSQYAQTDLSWSILVFVRHLRNVSIKTLWWLGFS